MLDPDDLDILILHGRDLDLVRYFVDFLALLDVGASSAIDLPSRGYAQEQKVLSYIKSARLILALVTFDRESPDSMQARPNVYLELGTCQLLRPADTIVLQEFRDGRAVELGSNLDGRAVVITFTVPELHRVFNQLLRELRYRGFIGGMRIEGSRRPDAAGREVPQAEVVLNEFLDKMDLIWNDYFDPAWEKTQSTSQEYESELAITLDMFFKSYQAVFDVATPGEMRGAELKAVTEQMLDHSWLLASRAWETACNATQFRAMQTPGALKHPSFQKASGLFVEARRLSRPTQKILAFRRVIEAFDESTNS